MVVAATEDDISVVVEAVLKVVIEEVLKFIVEVVALVVTTVALEVVDSRAIEVDEVYIPVADVGTIDVVGDPVEAVIVVVAVDTCTTKGERHK